MRNGVCALACVLGDLDLVRPLGLAGISCAVAAEPGSPVRFSRFTRAVLPWADPWKEPEKFVAVLLQFARTQREKPVLYFEGDSDLLVVSRFRDVLGEAFRFVIADAELVEDLVDKQRFQALAQRLGLPVPPAVTIDPAAPRAEVQLRFPVIVKPLTRRSESWMPVGGAAKALQVNTPAELDVLLPTLQASGHAVIVQELIPGDETRIESYHAYVNQDGIVVGEFTGRKIRTWPQYLGHSTALEITDAPDVGDVGRKVLMQIGLRGVAKCDFKRGPDGRLHLLEINPRFTLWHHPAALAGVNIPALVHADLTGGAWVRPTQARAGVRWCKVWSDAPAARANGVSAARWLSWAFSAEAKRFVSWDDPLPLLGAAMWRLVHGWRTREAKS